MRISQNLIEKLNALLIVVIKNERSLFEVERKYNASFKMIKKLMGEADTMREERQKGVNHILK